jgi:hypothetical protein
MAFSSIIIPFVGSAFLLELYNYAKQKTIIDLFTQFLKLSNQREFLLRQNFSLSYNYYLPGFLP